MDERDLVVDGVRLRTLEKGAGPAVLFVHGWAASRKFWRATIDAVGATRRAVAVDLPGFGASDKPAREDSIGEFAGCVGRIIDALGSPVDALVGHSMGGMIAAKLAIDRPEAMRKLVLVCAPVAGPTALFAGSRVMLWPGLRALMFAGMHLRRVRRWVTRDFTYVRPLDDELVDGIVQGRYRSLIRSARSLMKTDLSGALPSIRVPTLIVATDRDGVVRQPQYAIQHAAIPNARFELIAETGHCPMVERPEAFNAILEGFLNHQDTKAPRG